MPWEYWCRKRHLGRRYRYHGLARAHIALVTVQKLLGHANLQTTMHYDRRDACRKQQARPAYRSTKGEPSVDRYAAVAAPI